MKKNAYTCILDGHKIYHVVVGQDGVTQQHIDALYRLDTKAQKSNNEYIAPNLHDVFWQHQKNKWKDRYIRDFVAKEKRNPTKKELDIAWREAVIDSYGIVHYDGIFNEYDDTINVDDTDIFLIPSDQSPAEFRISELLLDMDDDTSNMLFAHYVYKITYRELSVMYRKSQSTIQRKIRTAVKTIKSDDELLYYLGL